MGEGTAMLRVVARAALQVESMSCWRHRRVNRGRQGGPYARYVYQYNFKSVQMTMAHGAWAAALLQQVCMNPFLPPYVHGRDETAAEVLAVFELHCRK